VAKIETFVQKLIGLRPQSLDKPAGFGILPVSVGWRGGVLATKNRSAGAIRPKQPSFFRKRLFLPNFLGLAAQTIGWPFHLKDV
jgi:hypothetical protein